MIGKHCLRAKEDEQETVWGIRRLQENWDVEHHEEGNKGAAQSGQEAPQHRIDPLWVPRDPQETRKQSTRG